MRAHFTERIKWDKKFGEFLAQPERFNKTIDLIFKEHDLDGDFFLTWYEYLEPHNRQHSADELNDDDLWDDDDDYDDRDEL